MRQINEHNYTQIIKETIATLGAVSQYLGKKQVNRGEFDAVRTAIMQLYAALKTQKTKKVREKHLNHYQRKIQEFKDKKAQLLGIKIQAISKVEERELTINEEVSDEV
jgi:hypothetical protein